MSALRRRVEEEAEDEEGGVRGRGLRGEAGGEDLLEAVAAAAVGGWRRPRLMVRRFVSAAVARFYCRVMLCWWWS